MCYIWLYQKYAQCEIEPLADKLLHIWTLWHAINMNAECFSPFMYWSARLCRLCPPKPVSLDVYFDGTVHLLDDALLGPLLGEGLL
jgi:hypothetical protein